MRVLRGIVLIFGLILIVIGISQPFFTNFWYKVSQNIVESPTNERIAGAVAVIFGVVLIVAAIKRAVAVPGLVFVLGLIMLIPGIIILIRPDFIAAATTDSFLNRPPHERRLVLLFSGLIRAIIGVILVAAVVNARPLSEQRGL